VVAGCSAIAESNVRRVGSDRAPNTAPAGSETDGTAQAATSAGPNEAPPNPGQRHPNQVKQLKRPGPDHLQARGRLAVWPERELDPRGGSPSAVHQNASRSGPDVSSTHPAYSASLERKRASLQFIRSDVQTICYGIAMSMGSLLLAGGAAGKRMALPNSRILIQKPPADLRDPRATSRFTPAKCSRSAATSTRSTPSTRTSQLSGYTPTWSATATSRGRRHWRTARGPSDRKARAGGAEISAARAAGNGLQPPNPTRGCRSALEEAAPLSPAPQQEVEHPPACVRLLARWPWPIQPEASPTRRGAPRAPDVFLRFAHRAERRPCVAQSPARDAPRSLSASG